SIGRAEPIMIGHAETRVGKPGYGPGWQRMASNTTANRAAPRRDSGGIIEQQQQITFSIGDRVFHMKFGMGDVLGVEGDKLDIQFDKAGRKKVISSFVSHK
ncbi:MAG: DNA helicase II, partial [Alphaproteobacteria bacterium]